MSRSALFVVDIQKELADDPANQIPDAQRIRHAGTKILESARGIIGAYREKNEQSPSIIVFVQHEEGPESGTLVRGSRNWELVFEPLKDANEEILVAKTAADTFESNTDLAAKLKADGVSEVTVFGIQSDCCVRATTKGALAAGFQATVLKGAHSTYDGKEKKAAEIEAEIDQELEAAGAKIVKWEDAIAAWEQRRSLSTYSIFGEL